jgi:hypothetical protein
LERLLTKSLQLLLGLRVWEKVVADLYRFK